MPASSFGCRACAQSAITSPPVEWPDRTTWVCPSRPVIRSHALSSSAKYSSRSAT